MITRILKHAKAINGIHISYEFTRVRGQLTSYPDQFYYVPNADKFFDDLYYRNYPKVSLKKGYSLILAQETLGTNIGQMLTILALIQACILKEMIISI